MIKKDATNSASHVWDWMFTSAARKAFEVFLRGRAWPTGSSMLMPGYIGYTEREGSGVLDPVRNSGTPFTLYPLGNRLQVDLNVIEKLLATGQHPMLLVIHYFGLTHVDLAGLQALCSRYGTILVEDCAHVPGPIATANGPGTFGGAAFHSLHKMLPVPDGGALRINDRQLIAGMIDPSERCSVSTLEQFAKADLPSISACRRSNYAWLAERLKHTEGVELLYPTIGELVPHDFPVRITSGLREKLYFALMNRDMPTIALYYRLVDEITPRAHPNSHALSKSILNLPVHQDTAIDDLQVLCDALEEELITLRK